LIRKEAKNILQDVAAIAHPLATPSLKKIEKKSEKKKR